MFTFLSCSQSLSYDSQTSESALGDQKPSQGYATNKHGDVILSSAGFAPVDTYTEIHKHISHHFQKYLVDTYISECQKDSCFLGAAGSFFLTSV